MVDVLEPAVGLALFQRVTAAGPALFAGAALAVGLLPAFDSITGLAGS